MPLDPAMRDILQVIGFDHGAELAAMETGAAVAMLRAAPKPEPANLVERWEDRMLETPGGPVPARIYWPGGSGPHPILMNFHGGGWVTGSVAGDDLRCQRLTAGARCITISVDYRLAPENPFPAGLDDCWAATQWAADHAEDIGGDRARIAVSGASAGANLAAAVAVRARDASALFPVFQLLYYPVVDATAGESGPPGGPYYLTREAMNWYWARYLGGAQDRRDPLVSPLFARHQGMAPALIVTAQLDPLAREGEAYHEALQRAGVGSRHLQLPGVVHGFLSFGPDLEQSRDAVAAGVAALRTAFCEA